MNTKLKIDRAKLAETFAEIRARPDLPEKAAPGLDFWLKDNAKEIHTQPEAELDKAIKSIESILADTKAPKHLPVIKNAPLPKLWQTVCTLSEANGFDKYFYYICQGGAPAPESTA